MPRWISQRRLAPLMIEFYLRKNAGQTIASIAGTFVFYGATELFLEKGETWMDFPI